MVAVTNFSLDTRPTPRTATVAILVAAVAALALGVGIGQPIAAVLGVGGAVVLGIGARALDEPAALRQAGGSIAAVAGAVLLVASSALGLAGVDLLLFAGGTLGLTLIAVDGAVGVDRERERTLASCASSNVVLFLVGSAVVAGVVLFLRYLVPAAVTLWTHAVAQSTLLDLVVVQCLLVLLTVLLDGAVGVLDRWVPNSERDQRSVLESLDDLGTSASDLPKPYLAVIGLQVLFALFPPAVAVVERSFGSTLGSVLQTGLLQHALALVAILLACLVVLGKIQRLTVRWLGEDPSSTLGVTAGGLLGFGLAVVLELVIWLVSPTLGLPDGIAVFAGMVGFAPFVLLGLSLVLGAVAVVISVTLTLARRGLVPVPGSGFAAGSALLAVTAGAGALVDLPAVIVFVGVAGAILSWDLGTHAIGLGELVGADATTDRAEFVHVSASTLVVGGGVALVTGVHYLLVPTFSVSENPQLASRSVLGLAGLAVAIVAFFLASYLRRRNTPT